MASESPSQDLPVYDLVGIGFGPANLSLAVAIAEGRQQGDTGLSNVFLERRPDFIWHPHMLLDGATIQISFLKDMATLRNPGSPYTFLKYLQDKGRLADFINLGTFYPDRIEYDDYFRWVAGQMRDQVRYGRQVESVEPIMGEDGSVDRLRISARRDDGEVEALEARHLIVGTGGQPVVPTGVQLEPGKIFHNCQFLGQVQQHFTDREAPYRFLVVGSGQSAAEIFQYLYSNYPNADVTATIRRYAYKPADSSKFVNEIFHPETVDFLYALPPEVREEIISTHADTNFSCVDDPLIKEIYHDLYMQSVRGENRKRIRKLMDLRGARIEDGEVVAEYYNKQHSQTEMLLADGLILATGYYREAQHPLLSNLSDYLEINEDGGYTVRRSYRIEADEALKPYIFLQGFSQDTHGISESLLSVLPVRAGEILAQLNAATGNGAATEVAATEVAS